jgi:hypothetical protein
MQKIGPNFYVLKCTINFTESIITKHIHAQQHYAEISYTEFYPNRPKSLASTDTVSLTVIIKLICTKFTFARQVLVGVSYTDFPKNTTNGSVTDTGSQKYRLTYSSPNIYCQYNFSDNYTALLLLLSE